MSAACHQKPNSPTKATNIQIRRVLLSDPSQVPSDLSSTPGGTLFSTTPGGTRIVYDRAFLLECRNSPLANSPPVGLPQIPGVTCTLPPGTQHTRNGVSPGKHAPGYLHGGHGHGHVVHHGHGHMAPVSPMTAEGQVKSPVPPHLTSPLATATVTVPVAPVPHIDEPQFDMDM
jgi:hypothetical protein